MFVLECTRARAIWKTYISAIGYARFDVGASCAVGSTQSAAALASRRLLFAFGVFCCLLCCASRARAPGARSPPFTVHMCRTLRSPRAPAASDHSLDQVPEPRSVSTCDITSKARGRSRGGGAHAAAHALRRRAALLSSHLSRHFALSIIDLTFRAAFSDGPTRGSICRSRKSTAFRKMDARTARLGLSHLLRFVDGRVHLLCRSVIDSYARFSH